MPDRISRYIAAVQPFAARVVLFHAGMAKKLGLNPAQFKYLRLVQIAGEAFATDLARECGLSLPAMTVILDRLESLGFVKRQRDAKDRRRYSVVAVPEQVKRIDAMYRKHSRKMAALLETYDDATFEGLLQHLNDASALIGKEIVRSAPGRLREDLPAKHAKEREKGRDAGPALHVSTLLCCLCERARAIGAEAPGHQLLLFLTFLDARRRIARSASLLWGSSVNGGRSVYFIVLCDEVATFSGFELSARSWPEGALE